MLIPAATSSHLGSRPFHLSSTTQVFAPDAPGVADLLRELLLPATGLPLPDAAERGVGLIALLLDPGDRDLGAEGYRLEVDDSGVTACAAQERGLRWAVQALRQLMPPEVYAPKAVADVEWTVSPATVVDVPRYPWRGLMVDVGRWCLPLEWLYTVVDLVSMHRMNVLHLHLTEDQGWRFEVKKYPRLTEIGAFRRESPRGHGADRVGDGRPHGGYYSQRELRLLVAYAAARGVTIVPEIDLPGHSQAAIAAYPALGNNPDTHLEVWTGFGVSPRILNVEDDTVAFMRDVLDELMDVFPSPFIHLGGDEVPTEEWAASPGARDRMRELGLKDPEELLGWWIRQLADHVTARGRRVVVWDELVGSGAPAEAVVMAWRDRDRVAAALDEGHDVVSTPHTELYLNYPASDAHGEPLSIASGDTDDVTNLLPFERIYAYDVEAGGQVGPTAAAVIGAQGNLWTEYAPTPARAEYDLLPRLAAVAELGWGGPRDAGSLRPRLSRHLERLDAMGVTYRPLDPGQ